MTWLELKNKYIKDHYSKMLEQPEKRISSLMTIEEILNDHYPEIINGPSGLKDLPKEELMQMVSSKKPSGKISASDRKVIDGLYRSMQK